MLHNNLGFLVSLQQYVLQVLRPLVGFLIVTLRFLAVELYKFWIYLTLMNNFMTLDLWFRKWSLADFWIFVLNRFGIDLLVGSDVFNYFFCKIWLICESCEIMMCDMGSRILGKHIFNPTKVNKIRSYILLVASVPL